MTLFGSAVVIGVAAHCLHADQVERQASVLLTHAGRCEDQQETSQATQYLRKYVALVPHDRDTLARLALLTAACAVSTEDKLDAAMRCDRALRRNKSRNDVRRQLARLWLECGRFADAASRAEELTALDSTDKNAWTILAEAYFRQAKYSDSSIAYKSILNIEPDNIDAAVALAYLCRDKLQNPRDADSEIDAMVRANPESARASLARYHYRRRYGMAEEGERDLEMALSLSPSDSAVLLAAANHAIANRELSRAIEFLDRGRAEHQHDARFDAALGRVYVIQGNLEDAGDAFRRGLATAPNDHDLLWRLGLVLIEQRSFDESEAVLHRLRQLVPHSPHLDFLRARTLEAKRDTPQATQLYENATDALSEIPELQSLAYFHLAKCYSAMAQWDLALIAYRRAAQIDPQALPPRLGLGLALERLGRLEEATVQYERLARMTDCPREVLVRLARSSLALEQRQPAARRTWDKFDELLDGLLQRAPDQLDLLIVKAHALALRGRKDEAITIARDTCESRSGETAAWLSLAATHWLCGEPAKAHETLGRAILVLGDRIAFRLTLADLLATTGKSREARAILEQRLNLLDDEDDTACRRALVRIVVAEQDFAAARKYLDEWRRRRPQDVQCYLAMLDLSFVAAPEAPAAWPSDFSKRFGGSLASLDQFVKARELWRTANGSTAALWEAKKILEEIKGRRPQWPQLYVLLGLVEESLNDSDNAIRAYGTAQELGDRTPEVARRQIQLLGLRGRYQEINAVLERLKMPPQATEDVQRYSSELSLRAGNTDQAMRLAEAMVASKPNDYRNQLWLGHLLWFVGRSEEAEIALQKATSLNPQAPEAWAALVSFYSAHDRVAAAKSTIDTAKSALTPRQAAIAVPQYFEFARMPARAEELFDFACAEEPNNSQLQQVAADFYFRNGRLKKADLCLRRAIAINPSNNRIRLSLAWVIASQRDYATWHEAVRLVEQNLATPAATAWDKKVKALLLAMRPHARNRADAIELLEELDSAGGTSPEDRFLLARLYFHDAQPQKGRELMTTLLGHGEFNPTFVAAYVDILIEFREVHEAEYWLTQLKAHVRERDVVSQSARLLELQQQPNQAVSLLRTRLEESAEQANEELLRDTVRVLSKLHWSKAAEELFHEVAGGRPELLSSLALWLGAHCGIDPALAVCRQVAALGRSDRAALLGIAILHTTDPSPDRITLLEGWVAAAIEQDPRSAELLFADALLRHLKGDHEESVRRFSNLLVQGADPMRALNNLSWVTNEGLKRPERALEQIELAVRQFGPVPSLLDTRGVILTRLGRYEEAIPDLEAAVSEASSISRLFHLATACFRGGQREMAKTMIERIEAASPILTALRESERAEFRQMKEEL